MQRAKLAARAALGLRAGLKDLLINNQSGSLNIACHAYAGMSILGDAHSASIASKYLQQSDKIAWDLHHMRTFAASSGGRKSAAVRRLQRASERAVTRPRAEQPSVVPDETPADQLEVANVVGHNALIIARPIEWGTVLLGFEQANRYTVYDQSGAIVAHLLEDEGSFGRAIGRQLLKTRRPFTATVLSPDGTQVIFRLRRPIYLINSSIYIEDGEGNVIGEVHQRWHLWRRYYDLYLDKRQFAAIEGGFLAWDFELKDGEGRTLALVDRNFQGFGKELFTDAGKYAIHFGESHAEATQHLATAISAQHPDKPPPSVTALAQIRNDLQVIPTSTGNALVVHRPLKLDERMVALAAAITIDYDYFSRHSYGGGVLSPFMYPPMMPYPVPIGGGGGAVEGEGGADGEGAAAAGGGAGIPGESSSSPSPEGEPLERDLGGDTNDSWGWGKSSSGTNKEQELLDDDWGNDDGADDEGGFGGLFGGLKDVMGWDDD